MRELQRKFCKKQIHEYSLNSRTRACCDRDMLCGMSLLALYAVTDSLCPAHMSPDPEGIPCHLADSCRGSSGFGWQRAWLSLTPKMISNLVTNLQGFVIPVRARVATSLREAQQISLLDLRSPKRGMRQLNLTEMDRFAYLNSRLRVGCDGDSLPQQSDLESQFPPARELRPGYLPSHLNYRESQFPPARELRPRYVVRDENPRAKCGDRQLMPGPYEP